MSEKEPPYFGKPFDGKRYLRVFSTRAGCQLSLNDRLVWAAVVDRASCPDGSRAVSAAAIARDTGLSRQYGVAPALQRLQHFSLVCCGKDGRWYALKPQGEAADWFVPIPGDTQRWYNNLAYFKVYLPVKGAGLSAHQAVLLGLLTSTNLRKARHPVALLMKLTGMSRSTVKRHLANLEKCGFLAVLNGGRQVGLYIPGPDKCHFFQDKGGQAVNAIFLFPGQGGDEPQPPQPMPPGAAAGPGRSAKVRAACNAILASEKEQFVAHLVRLGLGGYEKAKALRLIEDRQNLLGYQHALTMLLRAEQENKPGYKVGAFFLHILNTAARRNREKAAACSYLQPPQALRRTDDPRDDAYWHARFRIYRDGDYKTILAAGKDLAQVGARYPPYYAEDFPGGEDEADQHRARWGDLLKWLRN
jgi:hypothetical protein